MAGSPEGEERVLIIPAATDTNTKILFIIKNVDESLHIKDPNENIIVQINSTRMMTILMYNTGTAWRCVELLEM